MRHLKITLFAVLSFLNYQNLKAQGDTTYVAAMSKVVIETPNKISEIRLEERVHKGNPIDFMVIGHTLTGTPMFIDENGQVSVGTIDPCYRTFGSGASLVVEGETVNDYNATWTVTSDKRLKTNISPLNKSRNKFLDVNIYRFTYKKSGKVRYGIIAQEVKDMYPHSMGTFEEDGVEYLTFNPSNLFFEGMKVIQENAEDIIKHDEQIRNLEAENQDLRDKLEAQQKDLEVIKAVLRNLDVGLPQTLTPQPKLEKPIPIDEYRSNVPKLQQNIPNPFSQSTFIPYYLPENVRSATLVIFDTGGKTISKYTLPAQEGEGRLEIDMSNFNLRSGTYTYSIYVNDKLIDTKRMTFLRK